MRTRTLIGMLGFAVAAMAVAGCQNSDHDRRTTNAWEDQRGTEQQARDITQQADQAWDRQREARRMKRAREHAQPAAMRTDPSSVKQMVTDWPEVSRQAAEQMIQQYGQPDGVTPTRLIWNDRSPWKTIIVYKQPVDHKFPMPHQDVLEQVINYKVPADKFDELAMYDGSVIAERTKGTLAARCDKEPMNYLALNLAYDVITGSKSVEEARQFYADTVKAFMQGQRPEYTQRLRFEVPQQAGDPDQAVMQMQKQQQPMQQQDTHQRN